MDGLARDPRLRLVQRSYAPTRLSDQTLMGIYDRIFQARLVDEEVSELASDVSNSAIFSFVMTGGQHA
jgi:hypothetical protein